MSHSSGVKKSSFKVLEASRCFEVYKSKGEDGEREWKRESGPLIVDLEVSHDVDREVDLMIGVAQFYSDMVILDFVKIRNICISIFLTKIIFAK